MESKVPRKHSTAVISFVLSYRSIVRLVHRKNTRIFMRSIFITRE